MIRLCIAGATGWTGSALACAVVKADDLALIAAVSRSHVGQTLTEALGEPNTDTPILGSVADALELAYRLSYQAHPRWRRSTIFLGLSGPPKCTIISGSPKSFWRRGRSRPPHGSRRTELRFDLSVCIEKRHNPLRCTR